MQQRRLAIGLGFDLPRAVVVGIQVGDELACLRALHAGHAGQYPLSQGLALRLVGRFVQSQRGRAGGHVHSGNALCRQGLQQRHRHEWIAVANDAVGRQRLVRQRTRDALHTLGADLVLNGADKIALAGGHHHRQIVDSVKRRILHRHPLQLLVHRQAQPPANLLQLGDF